MTEIPFEVGSSNVFADLGFDPAEAELTAKSTLIIAMKDIIARRKLTQASSVALWQQPSACGRYQFVHWEGCIVAGGN